MYLFSRNLLTFLIVNQGQPSGEAFIQMTSEMAAYNCTQARHNRFLNFGKKNRYIEVFQCSGDDMNYVLSGAATAAASLSPGRPIVPHPGGMLVWENHPGVGAGASITGVGGSVANVGAVAAAAHNHPPPPLMLPPFSSQSAHLQPSHLHPHHQMAAVAAVGAIPSSQQAHAFLTPAFAAGVRPPPYPSLPAPYYSPSIYNPIQSMKPPPSVILPPHTVASRAPLDASLAQVSHANMLNSMKQTTASPVGFPPPMLQCYPSSSTAMSSHSQVSPSMFIFQNPRMPTTLTNASMASQMSYMPTFSSTGSDAITSKPPQILLPTPYTPSIAPPQRLGSSSGTSQPPPLAAKRSFEQAFAPANHNGASSSGVASGSSSSISAAGPPGGNVGNNAKRMATSHHTGANAPTASLAVAAVGPSSYLQSSMFQHQFHANPFANFSVPGPQHSALNAASLTASMFQGLCQNQMFHPM